MRGTTAAAERMALSVFEAAAAIGLSPDTIRKYIYTGKIIPKRVGRRVLIEPSELRRLLNGGDKQED